MYITLLNLMPKLKTYCGKLLCHHQKVRIHDARLIHLFVNDSFAFLDRTLHGTTKLTSYFAVLNYCLVSSKEKEMV